MLDNFSLLFTYFSRQELFATEEEDKLFLHYIFQKNNTDLTY